MNKNELKVGMLVDFGGSVAEVMEILPEGIVIESEDGEDLVRPSSLKPVRISAWECDQY